MSKLLNNLDPDINKELGKTYQDETAIRASQDAKWRKGIDALTGKCCGMCHIAACEGYGDSCKTCPLRKLAGEGVG